MVNLESLHPGWPHTIWPSTNTFCQVKSRRMDNQEPLDHLLSKILHFSNWHFSVNIDILCHINKGHYQPKMFWWVTLMILNTMLGAMRWSGRFLHKLFGYMCGMHHVCYSSCSCPHWQQNTERDGFVKGSRVRGQEFAAKLRFLALLMQFISAMVWVSRYVYRGQRAHD